METSWYTWLLENSWAIEIAFVLAGLILLNFFLKKIVLSSKRQAHFEKDNWRSHLDEAALTPSRILLWVLMISFLLELLDRKMKLGGLFSFVVPLRNVGIVFCLAWFLLRWKRVFHNAIASRRHKGKLIFDPVSLEIIGKIFTIGVIFLSLLIIMQLFGLDIIPLVTFGGIGIAAVGIASKDVIANFFGGLMLYVTRPFTAGDLVEIEGRKLLGHIEEIGWYMTTMRDLHKKPIYIPNAVFSTEALVNLSRITHRRIEETIQIRPEDLEKTTSILEGIRTLFEHNPDIDHHQPIHVFFKAFGSYSVDIEVQAYTLATRYEDFMEIRQEILFGIHKIIAKVGAVTPLPTSAIEILE